MSRFSMNVGLALLLALPTGVAGGAREQIRIRALVRPARRKESPDPCDSAAVGIDMAPCTPDFRGIQPSVPVTAEDLEKANLQAFVNEIVKDEDAKIASAARDAAAKSVARQQELRQNAAAVANAETEAAKSVQEKQEYVSRQLSNLTTKIVHDVAAQAKLLGQREQLAKDEAFFLKILESQASNATDSANAAMAKALRDAMRASATAKVVRDAQRSLDDRTEGTISEADVRDARTKAALKASEAKALSEEAVEAASRHVVDTSAALRGITESAKASFKSMKDMDEKLVSAYTSPEAFMKGIAQGTSGKL